MFVKMKITSQRSTINKEQTTAPHLLRCVTCITPSTLPWTSLAGNEKCKYSNISITQYELYKL